MNATATPVIVTAANLVKGDVFEYAYGTVTVLGTSYVDGRIVEVRGTHSDGSERFIDHGTNEDVAVIDGPSHTTALIARQPEVKAGPTATARALNMVKRLKGEPSSAVLVLYALAASEEVMGGAASLFQIACATGLSEGTVKGHLRTLERKGCARVVGYGWTVTR